MRDWARDHFRPAEEGLASAQDDRGLPLKSVDGPQVLRPSVGGVALHLLILTTAALLTRWGTIGNLAIHMDEQFYLVAADKMLHGSLVYVDVWDRKPIGLFVIYAGLRALGGNPVITYQIGALISVVATAFVLTRIAVRYGSGSASLLCGVAYLLYVPILGGAGGQSPIFYNLPMALAAWLSLRASEQEGRFESGHAAGAMLLVGVAIQIKYTALIEGIGFGLWLLWISWQRRRSFLALARTATVLAGIALLPTLLAALFFASKGALAPFVQANFLSIFEVETPVGFSTRRFLLFTLVQLAPLLLVWAAARLFFRALVRRKENDFLLIWTGFAVVGFVAIGNFYNHYALPLLMPLLLGCVRVFERRKLGAAILFVFLCMRGDPLGLQAARQRAITNSTIRQMTAAVSPEARSRCLYINDGPTIVYLLANACSVTPYLFPEHLNNAAENKATNAEIHMAEALARKPGIIMIATRILDHPRNAVTAAMIDAEIIKNYTLRTRLPDIYAGREQLIYERRAGH